MARRGGLSADSGDLVSSVRVRNCAGTVSKKASRRAFDYAANNARGIPALTREVALCSPITDAATYRAAREIVTTVIRMVEDAQANYLKLTNADER